jgi:ribonuclease P protein component
MKQSFTKEERLCSRRIISALFSDGQTFHVRPFRVTWMRYPLGVKAPVQVMMSIPKKNFTKAVERNLIRRRMKEAYRLNKQILYSTLSGTTHQIALCITCMAKEIVAFDLIESKIILLLQRLIEENEKVTG